MSQLCSSCSRIGVELPASEDVIKPHYWTVKQVLNSGNSSYWDRKPIGSFRIASRRSRAAHAESASDGCLLCQLLCYGAEILKGSHDLNLDCYHNGKGRDGLLPEKLKPHMMFTLYCLTFESTLRPPLLFSGDKEQENIHNLWFDAHTDEGNSDDLFQIYPSRTPTQFSQTTQLLVISARGGSILKWHLRRASSERNHGLNLAHKLMSAMPKVHDTSRQNFLPESSMSRRLIPRLLHRKTNEATMER
jgi:hypothetical protein